MTSATRKLFSLPNVTVIYGTLFVLSLNWLNTNAVAISGPLSNEEVNSLCKPAENITKDFFIQHTNYRIKDPRVSIPFYTGVLGLTLLIKLDIPGAGYSLILFGYVNPADIPKDTKERTRWAMSQKSAVELEHHWGSENDPNLCYHSGNSNPYGYGHIGIMVPDVYAASERFEELGVDFEKRPDDGLLKGIAFIRDPDGYWIALFNADSIAESDDIIE